MPKQPAHPTPAHISANTLRPHTRIDSAKYQDLYQTSIQHPEAFWQQQGQRIDWITPYTQVKRSSFVQDKVSIEWFYDGKLNASANCLDRHLAAHSERIAILWEGDDPAEQRQLTYKELHTQVCQLANVLRAQGVKKGDIVTIPYLAG